MTDFDVVLFDLGGVLIDFGGVKPMKAFSGIDDDEELWARWVSCEWVRTFERGDCTPAEFAAGVVHDWELRVEPDEFLASFRSWIGGPLVGADELVRETQQVTRVGCLSNTNSVHWDDQESRHAVLRAFDVRFLSFEIGCVKPDQVIFERVVDTLAVAPDRILFLDDNAINVDGARAAGFCAERAVGVTQARAELERLEVLLPS
jgi:putative hydrolase of the HAD superfamily